MENCRNRCIIFSIFLLLTPFCIAAQTKIDSLPGSGVSLDQCLSYALRHQPGIKQSVIDEQINDRNIAIGLSDWLPQLSTTANAQHYFELPSSYFQNQVIPAGAPNTSVLSLQANQVIYNSTVALAARTSKFSRQFYKQGTATATIGLVAGVSKAFYDVLLSEKQLDIINDDILRLKRSLNDAYNQYKAGLVDKIDYKQATIALNNEYASKKQQEEAVKSKTAVLQQFMGLYAAQPIKLVYDSVQLEKQIYVDTNIVLDVNNRIEYQQLQTEKTLDNINISYYKWNFLPAVSAFGSYNLAYFGSSSTSLYNTAYPNSLIGLGLTIPIFQGKKRLESLSKARLQATRADLDIENTRNAINTEYTTALAAYKSSYNDYQMLKQNVLLAQDVYRLVSLQYREGIKTYLNVITAQDDLRAAQLNYFNALFTVLSTKIDLLKSLGALPLQY